MNNINVFELIKSLENIINNEVIFSIHIEGEPLAMVTKENFKIEYEKNNFIREILQKEVKEIYPTNNKINVFV